MTARLKETYKNEVFNKLMDQFKYKNVMQVPKLEMPLMISEDFSFYGLHAPSVFFLLGTGTGISLHSTDWDFDETVLMTGFKLYKSLLEHTDFTY